MAGMPEPGAKFEAAIRALADATADACAVKEPEEALRKITGLGPLLLGNREAHLRPGALKAGERQFTVSGVFMLTPDGSQHLLVAELGFPPEQHRLRVDRDLGHPGWVAKHRRPLILANTDEHADFKQILKTARMGSAMYAPMIWQRTMLGQLVLASQARNTYDAADLEILVACAGVATALWVAHDGPALLGTLAGA